MGAAKILIVRGVRTAGDPSQRTGRSVDYPNRPIRVIVPVGAGAGIDTAARVTAAAAEPHLGGKFVIENKPGASQRIGLVDGGEVSARRLHAAVHQPVADRGIAVLSAADGLRSGTGVAAAGHRNVPAGAADRAAEPRRQDGRRVRRLAKNNPGKLSFGVQGLFGEMRLTLEHFKKTAGIDVTHVPYNSGAQAIVDLLSDRLDAMFLVIPPIKQHVRGRQAHCAGDAECHARARRCRTSRPWRSSAARR